MIGTVTGSPADFSLVCQVQLALQQAGVLGVSSMPLQLMGSDFFEGKRMQGDFAAQIQEATDQCAGWIHEYDQLIILGDRPEIAAVALMACAHNKVIHHLYAGDVSGCVDDYLRHMISVASTHLYCVGDDAWKQGDKIRSASTRVKTIDCVAPLPLEVADKLPHSVTHLLKDKINWQYAVACIHPETARPEPVGIWIQDIIDWAQTDGLDLLFIPPNGDPGRNAIVETVNELREIRTGQVRIHWMPRLSRPDFLKTLQDAEWIAGNSSAFVLEAPRVTKAPIKLYGNRQHDRACVTGEGLRSMTDALIERIYQSHKK